MPKPPLKFLIIGVRSTMNLGIMAIVTATIQQLEQRFHGDYTILTLTKEIDQKLYARALPHIPVKLYGIKTRKWLPYPLRVLLHIFAGFGAFLSADVVLDLSGEAPASSLPARSVEYALGRFCQKPIVVFCQSFYSSHTPLTQKLERFVLNLTELLIARENWSYQYLQKLGLNVKTRIASDPAFLLPTLGPAALATIWHKEAIPHDTPYITIAPTTRTFERNRAICTYLRNIITRFVQEYTDIDVVLIPHAIGPVSDGRASIKMLVDVLPPCARSRVHVLKGVYTAEEVKTVLSRSEILVSMRMHAAIGAVSTLVPAILISNLHKANLLQRFGLGDYICPEENLRESDLSDATFNLFAKRKDVTRLITKGIALSKQEAEEAFTMLEDVCIGERAA